MNVHRLSLEEQRAFDIEGVETVDDFGSAMLTVVAGSGRDVPFMIASVWIDESGTGGEPVLTVGGIGGSALNWLSFTQERIQLLNAAKVPHAHFYKMERNEGPFSNRETWNVSGKVQFVAAQMAILRKWCQFGLTVSVDKQLYRDVYRKDFPSGASPDSAYGVACKELVLATQEHCERFFDDPEAINFVVEEGHGNIPNAEQIFRDLKTCFPDEAKTLGTLFPMSRDSGRPLQAIDHLVVMARRTEPKMIADGAFIPFSEEDQLSDMLAKLPGGETFPIFYHPLTEDRLRWHRDHKVEMTKILRRLKGATKARNRASREQRS